MIPIAPHLQLFSFNMEQEVTLVLPADRHRTHFRIGMQAAGKDDELYIWIGINPPADIEQWIYADEDSVGALAFDYGLYGPIYIAAEAKGGGPTDGKVLILSTLAEDKIAILEPR